MLTARESYQIALFAHIREMPRIGPTQMPIAVWNTYL